MSSYNDDAPSFHVTIYGLSVRARNDRSELRLARLIEDVHE